jgi:hypothetical protein
LADGQEAARRGFAYAGTFSDPQWPPFIIAAAFQPAQGRITARVEVQSGKVVSGVWALVYPPSYQPPASGEDMAQDTVPRVYLSDPDGDGLYAATYNFTQTSGYRVVVYAADDRSLYARPREAVAEFESVNHAPNVPSDPTPADGAAGVPLMQTLRWQGGDPDGDVVTYTVAFGAVNPPPVVASNVTTNTYNPGSLLKDTTYYWAITARDAVSVTAGARWSFTTAAGFRVYLPLVVRQ